MVIDKFNKETVNYAQFKLNMIRGISLFSILFFACISIQAQTSKTGVLVVGNTPEGVAAAIQSARSGAKTIYLTQSLSVNPVFTSEDISFITHIRNYYAMKARKRTPATDSLIRSELKLEQAVSLMQSIADTVKNLSLNHNNVVDDLKKDGKGWEVRLKGGERIKADVVVDATENLSVSALLGIDTKKTMALAGNSSSPFDNKLYRTTVALAYPGAGTFRTLLPMAALIPQSVENFVILPRQIAGLRPAKMSAGRAAGTIAAYCAFFKTTTKNINVRVTQGELLAFNALLIPYSDIDRNDPNFLAFQRLGLSGLIKPKIINEEIRFDTAGTVSHKELQVSMKEFYTRSQLWFADNKNEVLTIEDVISLLMFTAARGNELKKEIEEGWKQSFRLNSSFDPKRNISRKEFGVLADKYLQPYNIRVDMAGNLLR
jgi:hypothetical protein